MISPYLILAIGVVLIVAELLMGSFFLMFFGAGFLIAGVVGLLGPMGWYYQILLSCIASVVLLFTLKKPIKEKFYHVQAEIKDDFLNESGEGEVRQGMVYFKGTLWQYDGSLAEGTKVKIIGTKGNRVVLK